RSLLRSFHVFSFYFCVIPLFCFFFLNHTSTPLIFTLSLHDALPISLSLPLRQPPRIRRSRCSASGMPTASIIPSTFTRCVRPLKDRKSTRLNSSHVSISYAVFCLKKKKNY